MNTIPSGEIKSHNTVPTPSVVNEDSASEAVKSQTTEKSIDPAEIATKSYSRGINEGKNRVLNALKKQGIIPVMNSDGEVDYDATISSIGKATKKSSESSIESNDQISVLQQRLIEIETKAQKAEEEKQSYIIDSQITTALSNLNIVNGKAAKTLFKAEYDIRRLADGELRVYQDNKPLLDANGDWMSIETATKKFINENKYLMRASNLGNSPSKDDISGRKVYTREDLKKGRVKPEDLKDAIISDF